MTLNSILASYASLSFPQVQIYIYNYLLDTFSQISNMHLKFRLLKKEVIFLYPLSGVSDLLAFLGYMERRIVLRHT